MNFLIPLPNSTMTKVLLNQLSMEVVAIPSIHEHATVVNMLRCNVMIFYKDDGVKFSVKIVDTE